METEESRIRKYSDVICRYITDETVVVALNAEQIFNDDESDRIKTLYRNGKNQQATSKMLDLLLKSGDERKMGSFRAALRENGHEYLEKIITGSVDPEKNPREVMMIRLFQNELAHNMRVRDEILTLVFGKGLIEEIDRNEVLQKCEQEGAIRASLLLIDKIQKRKAPKEWYYGFLQSLVESKHESLAYLLEPDFENNPSSFSPEKGQAAGDGKLWDDSVKEFVLTDFGEAYKPSNNLSDQPLPAFSSDDGATASGEDKIVNVYKRRDSDIQNNLDTMNIKLPLGKLSLEEDTSAKVVYQRDEPDEIDDKGLESDDDNIEVSGVNTWSDLSLRPYQLELAENALQGRNTIVCSGTGSGKTWVALYIVEQHFKQVTKAPKKAVFMARTGALVKQQADRFKKYLQDLQTKLVTGDDEDSKRVGLFLADYDVIFLTPQILINNLENGSVGSLRDFSLLILDECHHTKKDEPYNNLMRKYLVEKREQKCKLPQIVGLTASIGVGKSSSDEEACEYIMQMCARLDSRVISTVERNKDALKMHTAETSEEIITMATRKEDPCKDILMKAIEEIELKLEDLSLLQPAMIDLLCNQIHDKESQDYQKWTVDAMKTATLHVEEPELARDIRSCAMYLNVYNAALEVNSLLQKRDVAEYLGTRHKNETKDKMSNLEKEINASLHDVQRQIIRLNYVNPNLDFVRDTLYKMLQEKGEDSRAMVFVKARATCRSLAKYLEMSFREDGIKVKPLYGKETKGSDEGMTEAQQNEAIDMFRQGTIKVLVATSIGSEGLDIPDCNIVLSYNYSGNEVSKIQMKGRSRKKGGANIIYGSERTVQQEQMNAYKAAMMQRALNMFIELQKKSPKAIEKKIALFQAEEMQKYRFKQEMERVKLSRKKSEKDKEILCARCSVFLCHLSDVRVLNRSQHIVINKEFEDRVELKPHRSPKKYDGIHKKFKMKCKNCPIELGIGAECKGLPCRIFKLTSLKFRDSESGEKKAYNNWMDVPYDVQEINEDDLQNFIG